MVEDAEKYKEQDEQLKAAVAARNELETYVYQMKSMVSGSVPILKVQGISNKQFIYSLNICTISIIFCRS